MKKTCPKCKKIKLMNKFGKRTDRINQPSSFCLKCLAAYTKIYTTKHKEARKEYNRIYKQKNKKKLSEYNKKYLAKYYRDNKRKLLKLSTIYIRERRRMNLEVRILHNLRRRLHHALHGRNKSKRTLDLLGCDVVHLRKYLESGFKPEMSWENYGHVWHIDHKRPLSKFNLMNETELKSAMHFKNLQPLFARDNLCKSNKY